MGTPYVGEIRIFAGNFAPLGWMFCAGQILPISEYDVLFNLIATTYGGDGQSTFGLPDLQGRVPVHQGNGFLLGQKNGTETVTLNTNQIAAHTHPFGTDTVATTRNPGSAVPAEGTRETYNPSATGGGAISPAPFQAGGSQPHNNMAPTIGINYIISLFGIFPTQN